MLDGRSSLLLHSLQNLSLIILSLAFLPVDTTFLLAALVWSKWRGQHRDALLPTSRKTILVTGVGMTKGLVLARLFASTGHKVIGADFSTLACGRFSRSLKAFYPLQLPESEGKASEYVQSVLSIIRRESVDLWVSCSGVASAIEDGMAKDIIERATSCKAVQYDVETTQVFHEKSSFISRISSLGLTVPETYTVTSREDIGKVLTKAHKTGKQYICKSIGLDDASRGDMTILPLATPELTRAYIMRLTVSKENPWIVQQFINGKEYCTHALVVRGRLEAFVTCPSSDLLMHYVAMPTRSPLSEAMMEFTKHVAHHAGPGFTGHLSFDFLVPENDSRSENIVLYPIECNPRAHTAVALFARTPMLVNAYLSVLEEGRQTDPEHEGVVYPVMAPKYYWIGHDLVCRICLPLLALSTWRTTLTHALDNLTTFADHLLFWKDGTFEWDDPVPWWVLYHAYLPVQFFHCLYHGQKWSRANVSTTKLFKC